MTIEDMLTMQSGLARKESGYAYEPRSDNDVVAIIATNHWMHCVIDRPMAARPGTTFVYESSASCLVRAVVLEPRDLADRQTSTSITAVRSSVGWVEQSTTDLVGDPLYQYGYLGWLDRAARYAYTAGLYGRVEAVVRGKDLVAVGQGAFPATVDATAIARWLFESTSFRRVSESTLDVVDRPGDSATCRHSSNGTDQASGTGANRARMAA